MVISINLRLLHILDSSHQAVIASLRTQPVTIPPLSEGQSAIGNDALMPHHSCNHTMTPAKVKRALLHSVERIIVSALKRLAPCEALRITQCGR